MVLSASENAQVGALGATLQEGRAEPLRLLAGKTNVKGPSGGEG